MKCKIVFLLMTLLMSMGVLYASNDNEHDDGVVITPHKKVCILPDQNAPAMQQMYSPSIPSIMRGSLAYGNDVQHANMYHFDIAQPFNIVVNGDASFSALCGDFAPDDPEHMWVIDFGDSFLKKVNLLTLQVVDSVDTPCPLEDGIWSSLSIHKSTGQFYGIATSGVISVVYEINPSLGSVSELVVLDIVAVISSSFDMDGMLYMFDIDTDQIFVMDVNSLYYEPLGPAGFDGNYAQGMGLDPVANEVYLAAYVDGVGAELRLLDKGTGSTTLIESLPGETGAFGFPVMPENDFIISGIDEWCATGASVVFADNGDLPTLPPDFFYPGSEPFEGAIVFQGEASEGGQLPFADVTIMRLDDVYFNQPYPSTGLVELEIVSLKLKSKEPVFIPPESFFDVFYEIQLGNDQFGYNNITKESPYGGVFTKELMFYPQITFVSVDNPGSQIVYEAEFPLMLFSPDTYNWTMSPIPNDFDPVGEDPFVLLTEGGGSLELWPFLSREDFSFLAMDETGVPLEWFGTGYNDGQWYEYPNYGWWNVWLYDHPYDNSRSKYVRMELDVMPLNPDIPSDVTIVYNWSTENWPGWPEVDRPPLPEDVPDPIIEDELIVRSESIFDFQGIINQRELIVNEFVIEGYNPEWLSLDVMGSNFVMNANVHHVCFKPYIPSGPNVGDLELKIGDWLNPETWHNWIGGMDGESEIQLMADDPNGDIMQVDFLFSMDMGQTWQLFYTDTDGSEPALSTYGQSGDGDGWLATFYHELVPVEDFVIMFRADALLENGEVLSVEKEIEFDPTPPDGTIINLEDWMIIDDEYILLEVDPGSCIDLDYLWWDLVPKVDSFAKGISPISQQPHSTTHCSPTAAAACLKYFESQGDNAIGGGLTDHQLVDALAAIMKTNQGKNGTYISDIASGLLTWVNNHGGNYTVRKMDYDWETMRNELERCQDVISSIWWPGGGGHSMTFNSIVNEPNADGTITVDWMDPWTGQIEYGQITPSSGHVGNMGGAGGGGSGTMGTMVIVCPKEDGPIPDPGQVVPGPFPQPGIIIPIPNPGLWWLRIKFFDQSMHVARLDLVIKREDSGLDFGDCPDDPYPTLLANNGASHYVDGITYLGLSVDTEPDGQPNSTATGDDNDGNNDNDGILFGPIMTGSPAQITVTTSVKGYLQGWMDFNQDGDWADAGEQIFMDEYIHFPSTVCLNYMVPKSANDGNTFARFRFASFPGLSYDGSADDGEVEDYMVEIFDDQGYKWKQDPCPELPGLHAHDYIIPPDLYDYIVIADDWECNGGLVTEIQWWGNYEDVGFGINHFHLSIHEAQPDGCLPMQQEMWGMDVPIDMANEVMTTLVNNEGLPIYEYNYILDIPFEQIEGNTYWLDICAFSNVPDVPAIWRWQESDRSTVPILCTAASWSLNQPQWSSIVWTAIQPVRFTDMAFAITSSPITMYEYGDAPDDAVAYLNPVVTGSFPTCEYNLPAGNFIKHLMLPPGGIIDEAYFGPKRDPEGDGNSGICPPTDNHYNWDECYDDGDAGLIEPGAFTIIHDTAGNPEIVPCLSEHDTKLGDACGMAYLEENLDIYLTNNLQFGDDIAYFNLLIDWNQDGLWQNDQTSICNVNGVNEAVPEHIYVNIPVGNGFSGTLSYLASLFAGMDTSFRIGPNTGYVWARFSITEVPVQFSDVTGWDGSGTFGNGETEDYLFYIGDDEPPVYLDWGDAPDDPYPTLLASDGARHVNGGIVYLGDQIDSEADGQPNTPANGDDIAVSDDEDGVVFRGPLVAGSATTLKVKASVDGKLNVWLDVDRNGSWAEAVDHVFVDYTLVAGWNTLALNVPASAKVGISYMRFRFSQEGGEDYDGLGTYGEVEDYLVKVYPENWGFIPTPTTHNILVPLNVLLTNTTLAANDAIGVWYEDDNGNMVCGGAEIWDGAFDRVVLAHADDNTTPDKDGFDDGEVLTWTIHHTGSGADEVVSVSYDATFPQNDGKFVSFGLSKLTEITGLSATAVATPTTICAGDVVQLDVIVSGGSGSYTYSWSSNPTGFFSNWKNPTDTPTQDIVYTVVVDDGVTSVSSSVGVSVQPGPIADAGPDGSVCVDGTYQLDGAVANSNVYYWSTAGDGTFDDSTLLDAMYAPGSGDAQAGQVTLTLTANAIPPCQIDASASMTLIVLDTQKVSLFTGWNGLSSYLSPINQNNNYQLFGPVLDNLVLVYNFDGTFWPNQGTDNLVWDEGSGYVIKLEADDEMIFCGYDLSSLVVNLDANWNIIPVLNDTDVDITSIFDGTADVKLVLEVAGWKLFWPDYNINTILNLETGMSYFVFMNNAGSIDYANASNKSAETGKPVLLAETPWNEVNRSPAGHVVAFSDAACEKFVSGDIIGAFTNEGLCAGIAPFEAVSTGIILKGDDPYTLQVDGFAYEETVDYKLYRTTSGDLFDLQVEYDPDLDHSGRYHDFGMSAVTELKLQPTVISGYALSEIHIFPNPSHGIFNIDGISGETEIAVYDVYGKMVHELMTIENTRINLSAQADGIYLVKIKSLNGTLYQKVVIN